MRLRAAKDPKSYEEEWIPFQRKAMKYVEPALLRTATNFLNYQIAGYTLAGVLPPHLLDTPFSAAEVPVYVNVDAVPLSEGEALRAAGDVSADERTLRRLAESTGGDFLRLSEWNTLPSRMRAARR